MSTCCAKPISKIIRISSIEVDIKGLEQASQDVHYTNEKDLLLAKIKEYGNYVSTKRK